MAGGLQGLQQLSIVRLGITWHTYQLVTQLLSSAQDISMWLILLSLFGMTQERQWRRATGWIIAIYLTAQFIDVTTIWFWERGGALPWIDGITTAVYSLTPLYVFFIIGFGLDAPKSAFALAFDHCCLCERPSFLYRRPGWARRTIHALDRGRIACRVSDFTSVAISSA